MRFSNLVFFVALIGLCASFSPSGSSPLEPVIYCRSAEPTRDKPQSKLWWAQKTWWAWLPDGDSGGRLWRRRSSGHWQAQSHLDSLLGTLPGRADVWAQGDLVVSALVEDSLLAVACLQWNEPESLYEIACPPLTWRESSPVETVTIDRDATGAFWVAYPLDAENGRQVVVRKIPADLSTLGRKITLAEGLYGDEICAVTALGNTVGVMWSDQNRERVLFRRHTPGAAASLWEAVEVVDSGNRTADDHINFCRPPEGSGLELVAATKTSLDSVGEPLLSLRVLPSGKRWFSVSFSLLKRWAEPSRPVALWVENRPVVLYTLYGPPGKKDNLNRIMLQNFSPEASTPVGEPRELIPPVEGVNNVTGPKHLPQGAPVLILASDNEGRVYEAFVNPD